MYTVMIVDDEKNICEGLASKISRIKELNMSKIIIQTDSIEAKKLALTIQPDIIITDIKMPGMTGIELMEIVKSKCPYIKFIVLSGYNDFPYVRNSFRLGAIDYLLKPVGLEELKERLTDIITILGRERNTEHKNNTILLKESYNQPDKHGYPSHVDLAQEYIIKNFNKNITMADVANSVHLSYSYFSKLFKEETGMTFSKYLTKVRMEKAKSLLQNPIYRINEIADLIGYDNIYHFSRTFKDYYGISPKQYRKSNH